MAGVGRFKFLAIAIVFHLVYIYSIFDIYFVSPIVSGMRLYQVERPSGKKAPSDRLVLFVGMIPCTSRIADFSLTGFIRRWITCRQSLSMVSRTLSEDRPRSDTAATCAVPALPHIGTWYFRRIPHKSSHRVSAWTCCSDSRSI